MRKGKFGNSPQEEEFSPPRSLKRSCQPCSPTVLKDLPASRLTHAGAPSVVNAGTGVGATELLKSSVGQILQLDFQQPVADLAGQISDLLADRQR